MNKIEVCLQQKVQELFEQGRVDLVVGYQTGSLPFKSRPCFIYDVKGISRLIWNSFCKNNLAVYLKEIFKDKNLYPNKKDELPKVGIIAKGCDARSVAGLVKENQIPKENIIIIGMPCNGMADINKINHLLGGDYAANYIKDEYEFLEIETRQGKTLKLYRQDIMTDACRECSYPSYENPDIKIPGEIKEISPSIDIKVNKFELLSREQRWEYFKKELAKCIRCNACRQACPNCFCTVCFADQTKPQWIGAGHNISNIMLYHIGRIFHQAGRCVGCDACVQACPMGIDLRTFTQKIAKDVKDLYAFVPGLSMEQELPLCEFDFNDSQDFMTEP